MLQTQNQPEYITATIEDWNHLLKEDEYKMLIINVLNNLVLGEKIEVYAFCIKRCAARSTIFILFGIFLI
jgi:hypothetical protein